MRHEIVATSSLRACYHRHEQEKRRRYDRKIGEVERSSFLPVVFSATGGCGKGATALLKRIAHLQASRSKEPYSVLMALLRCRLGFSLLRASVMCLRGAQRMCMASPKRGMCLPGRRRGPGGCLNFNIGV